ncbi:signal recognition particle subunit SRP68 [Canna indica]|uniref:Signal recognition particle subunit SRP68 n=1 Tax=Canna indica TaxID=4628 RepID=A0AAQ3QKH7_9LILI|nr:signal recognition particle subunit SRP68 [Canna indica]
MRVRDAFKVLPDPFTATAAPVTCIGPKGPKQATNLENPRLETLAASTALVVRRIMSKRIEATPMEVDDDKSIAVEQITPKFSISVLQLVKSAQMQHGLRHRDYTRYRRYCTARLRRLYKSLKFTHGRGKYTRKTITESTITDVRFLHIVLYMAERAWSYAMEKKQLPDGPNSRQRIHLLGRLRKAVKWATLFAQLCAAKGDSRTSLEAEAYASYMKGSLLFEQDQNWQSALMNFKNARAVYEELGKYGNIENQVLCRERVEELEPSIRYCLHKVGESNLQTSELLDIGEMEGPALDLFKSKLEAVMAEARSQQAASMTEFCWLGHRFPINNAKTRVSILKAQELEKDLHGSASDSLPSEKKLAMFDKIFSAYHDARSCIRNDLATAGNAENVKDDLNGLDKAISAVLGQRTIERNQLLVAIAKSKFTKHRDDKADKVTKPEELVRLYDLLIQNTSDLSDLVSSGKNRNPEEVAFVEECVIKGSVYRAERCFYLAKSYSAAGKRAEAYLLFCHARSLADTALDKLQMTDKPDQTLIRDLKTLSENCRSNSCIEHAAGVMEEEKIPEKLSKGVSTISLTGQEKKVGKFLLEMLDVYESAVGDPSSKLVARITPFPPPFQAVPCNPIVLDIAYSSIEFPSLENRMKKDKKGIFSRLWR